MKLQACECTQSFDITSHPYGFFYITALTTIGILATDIAAIFFSHSTGLKVNPRHYLSEQISSKLDVTMSRFRDLENKITGILTFGKVGEQTQEFIDHALIAPIAEELLFRGLIQNIFFLNVPQLLGINYLDSPHYTIFRIIATASLFATAHINYWEGKEGILPEFASGIIFGIATEYFGMSSAIASHMLINAKNVAEDIAGTRLPNFHSN